MSEIVIKATNLTKSFGDFIATNNVSFEVQKGEVFGFLGANGAGKTTAIRMLCGLITPTSGHAIVGGYDVATNPEEVKRIIGYMSQKFSLYENLTVKENIEFYAGIYGLKNSEIENAMNLLLKQLDLANHKNALVGSLPLGWKQKLAFSVAIIHQPKVVFLDEPTGGVDPITRREFWHMIHHATLNGTTVFVTTHYMDEAEYCDRVSIMVDGKIEALDTPDALKSKFNVKSMESVFIKLARNAIRSDN